MSTSRGPLRYRCTYGQMMGPVFGFGVAVGWPGQKDGWWRLDLAALLWRVTFYMRPFYKDEEE